MVKPKFTQEEMNLLPQDLDASFRWIQPYPPYSQEELVKYFKAVYKDYAKLGYQNVNNSASMRAKVADLMVELFTCKLDEIPRYTDSDQPGMVRAVVRWRLKIGK